MTRAVSTATQSSSSSTILDQAGRYAHWAPRIALASVFLYHGLTKFPDLGGMAAMMGVPVALWTLVAILETAGGALILVGGVTKDWVTRLAGLLLLPPMLGAIATVHWPQWAFVPSDTHPMGGMEFQVTLLLISLFFVLRGNGESQSA